MTLGPLRKVVAVPYIGAGTDELQLECGHHKVVNHRSKQPARTRCIQCRGKE